MLYFQIVLSVIWLLQVIVVGVGTMNYMHTPEQVVNGILEIVKTCHEKQPQAEVLVMVDRACLSCILSFH